MSHGPDHGPRAGGLDWNAAWQAARARAGNGEPGERRARSPARWNRRAPSFAKAASRTRYVASMLDLLSPRPGETVLDVGCGAGALAVPLARRARAVTALDFSARMLEALAERCAAEGVANVRPVLGAWEDDWSALGVEPCDVALASRSLAVHDLRAALEQLHRFATREVVVSAPVGDGPVDRRAFEAAGRARVAGPDWAYPYGLARDLGWAPEVTFVEVRDARPCASVDEGLEALRWWFEDPTPEELARLRAWLERELVPGPAGLELATPHVYEWAVIRWRKPRGAGG